VDLPGLVGVDLVHCERQAAVIVGESKGSIVDAQVRPCTCFTPRMRAARSWLAAWGMPPCV
jgi:hypothetical protein